MFNLIHRYICGLHMCATNWTPAFSACGSLMALLHHNPAVGGGTGDSSPPSGTSPSSHTPTQQARRPSSRSPTTPSAHQHQNQPQHQQLHQNQQQYPHQPSSSSASPAVLVSSSGGSNSGASGSQLKQSQNVELVAGAAAAPVVTMMGLSSHLQASPGGGASNGGPSTVTCSLALMRSCSPSASGSGGFGPTASITSQQKFSASVSMDTSDLPDLRTPAGCTDMPF